MTKFIIDGKDFKEMFDAWMFSTKDVRRLHEIQNRVQSREYKPDTPLEKCPFCNDTDTCKKCDCFPLNRIQAQCKKVMLIGKMQEVEDLQKKFMGKTDSEIKDIMFFRKLELESARSKL